MQLEEQKRQVISKLLLQPIGLAERKILIAFVVAAWSIFYVSARFSQPERWGVED
jgi:hypothetical protein